jgi:hypothetical protein
MHGAASGKLTLTGSKILGRINHEEKCKVETDNQQIGPFQFDAFGGSTCDGHGKFECPGN